MTQWGVATDAGGRRSVNEDAAFAQEPVFVVADGMGGHARGEMASQAVVEAFRALAARGSRHIGADEVGAAVREAAATIRRTMEEEAARSQADGRETVAGTTVAGVVLTEQDGEPYWLVLNVGDSRVYRFSAGRLQQVSVDHSLVQEMVDAGTIDAAEARTHPRRNVITRAIGTGPDAEVDFWMLRVQPGERILLCTDGLVGELDDAHIADVLASVASPVQAAQTLLCHAVTGGASDNVTVVVVDAPDEASAAGTTARTPGSADEDEDEDEDGTTLPGEGDR
ncbi:protein phosphatase 2C domain-containing protein [Georgenia sp. EYE_87]|uniref:PP2C family protein-serine/threonine phosphatase n=1 Tax=Georgenia sp. EYE_87 TaxID=2853448 RepID=UPI002002C918|nr:protein phosphatase 2C domain-containing protein [Georgenia sp. EYE_87]MCK6209445.1 protein phosphatase 2C domain-containing protein [Georgenia sp. EYE_87]